MLTKWIGATAAIPAAIVMLTAVDRDQVLHQVATGGSTRVVSASVVAMWQASGPRGGPAVLTYAVLWRGSPGWAVQDSVAGESSGLVGRLQKRSARYGPHELTASFDPDKPSLLVGGKEVDLGFGNVVLIDHVDQPDRIKIFGVFNVDGAMPDGYARLDVVTRKVPELGVFLQCSLRLPESSEAAQRILDERCTTFSAGTRRPD